MRNIGVEIVDDDGLEKMHEQNNTKGFVVLSAQNNDKKKKNIENLMSTVKEKKRSQGIGKKKYNTLQSRAFHNGIRTENVIIHRVRKFKLRKLINIFFFFFVSNKLLLIRLLML